VFNVVICPEETLDGPPPGELYRECPPVVDLTLDSNLSKLGDELGECDSLALVELSMLLGVELFETLVEVSFDGGSGFSFFFF
jgi:hypothetical protein